MGTGYPTSPGNYPGAKVLVTPLTVFFNGTYWEITFDVAGFSGFYVHTNFNGAPLPIIINYLNGHKQGNNHLLDWKVTCTSSPHVTMTLERSSDARNFTGLYTITADAARCAQPFDYTDAGVNYYRLKMTDVDGKVSYSSIVSLINATKGIDVMNIAPNPVVNGNFNLKISSAEKMQVEILITDMQGRVLQKRSVNMIAGFNEIPMNVSNLLAGTYQLFGNTTDGRTKVLRFVIQ